ncbi:MAG: hypothetical protein IPH24_17880 [Crocinitomicaceae bacterium]|nr:hypothetical protein [Crocinitomicaceae bacterium]
MEKPALEPLPEKRFEMRKQLDLTVMKNGHVHLDLIDIITVFLILTLVKGTIVTLKIFVEIYHRHELIASHPRVKVPAQLHNRSRPHGLATSICE